MIISVAGTRMPLFEKKSLGQIPFVRGFLRFLSVIRCDMVGIDPLSRRILRSEHGPWL
jgi:hypothetical protein